MTKPISFCQDWDPLVGSYPKPEDLVKLEYAPKLTQIKYKAIGGDKGLYAMQLVFNDGSQTPLFETNWRWGNADMVDWETQVIDIDPKHTITTIAMKVWDRSEIGEEDNTTGEKLTNSVGYGSTFLGIKLENENFKEIIKVEWGTNC